MKMKIDWLFSLYLIGFYKSVDNIKYIILNYEFNL